MKGSMFASWVIIMENPSSKLVIMTKINQLDLAL